MPTNSSGPCGDTAAGARSNKGNPMSALTSTKCLLGALVFASLMSGACHAQTTDADELSKARSVGNTNRAQKVFYTKEFDLSGLPEYQPSKAVSGTIVQWGNNYLADSGLMKTWQDAFRVHHPDVGFDDHLYSSSVAIPSLITGVADMAPMGRQALWDELKGLERASGQADTDEAFETIEIIMATGSFNVRGWTFALGVFVHEDNPVSCLSLDQLDGIFGSQRDGGWDGLTWDTSVARGPDQNIREWGEAGLGGEWADRPISVYGYNPKYHFNDEIDKKVLKGSGKWNEGMRAYSNMAGLKADGSLTAGGELIMNGLSEDTAGIAYTGIPFLTEGTKPIALSIETGGDCIPMTLDTVQDRSYPLIRDVYIYLRRPKGGELKPAVREFMNFILSREGQEALQRDGKYLPLTDEVLEAQRRKLD